MKSFLVLAALIVAFAVAASVGLAARSNPTSDAGSPVCFLFEHARMKQTGIEPAGLVFAVWDDGVVLSAKNHAKPGENMMLARLRVPVAEFLDRLKTDGVFDLAEYVFTVPDGRRILFRAQRGDQRASLEWGEVIMPNYGHNTQPSDAYRDFVKAWFMARITIAGTLLDDRRDLTEQDLTDGAFRGYVVDQSSRTAWLRAPAN